MDRTGETSIATDFLSAVGGCGERLPSADPLATELRAKSIARLQRLIGAADAPLSVDDRSDAQANLMELLDHSGRHEEAVQVARARAKLLEEAAEELLAAREKEMPGDYNPPARLARVLLEQKKLAEAEAAVDRALSKMTRGQRRIGVLGLKSRILEKEGKPTTAVVQEQLEVVRELPRTQRSPELEAQLQKKLAEAQKR
jgi:hypothetical protein